MGKDNKKKKRLSKEDKKNLTRCSVLLMASLVNLTVASLAWFTNNRENDIRPNRFDTAANVDLASKIPENSTSWSLPFSQFISALGFNDHKTSDAKYIQTSEVGSEIQMVMTPDENFGNYSDSETDTENEISLYPGTSGKLTFYIVPKIDGDMKVNIVFNLVSYNEDGSVSADTLVNSLLKGHILFFKNRDPESGVYSDLIYDKEKNTFSFELLKQSAEKGKYYPVTFYWVWPRTSLQLICSKDELEKQTMLNDDEKTSIIDDGAREMIKEIMTENISYFVSDSNLEITEEKIDSKDKEFINYIKRGWDKSDQRIGMRSDYILLKITAER